jgi:hypothetical protein
MCKRRAAAYEWEEYTDAIHIFTEQATMGVINVYDAYDRAAHEQAEGTYNKWGSRFVCEGCTVDSLVIYIGRPRDAVAGVISGGKELATRMG